MGAPHLRLWPPIAGVIACTLFACTLVVCTLVVFTATPADASRACVVSTNQDAGAGSLRQALTELDSSNGRSCSVIAITAAGVLTLTSPLPVIRHSVSLVGPGVGELTIDGTGRFPILQAVRPLGLTMKVSGLTLANGKARGCRGCRAGYPDGGALLVVAGARARGQVSVRDVAFVNNAAAGFGGAVSVMQVPLVISQSSFTSNSGFSGGAVFHDSGNVTIMESTFAGNRSQRSGSALAVRREDAPGASHAGRVLVSHSTFTDNSAVQAGGVLSAGDVRAVVVSNSTFADNPSLAMSLWDTAAVVQYCTVVANGSGQGPGGILARTITFTLVDSLLWANRGEPADLQVGSGTALLAGDLFSSRSTVAAPAEAVAAAGLVFDTNPLLGPLSDNGGSTQTMLPSPSSPVVGNGTGHAPWPTTTDQRGQPRPAGGAADIGSVELS